VIDDNASEKSCTAIAELLASTTPENNQTPISIPTPPLDSRDLVTNKKDPAYYGKTVIPKDADKVLLRWKLSDSEYRVIFDGASGLVSNNSSLELSRPYLHNHVCVIED
jgi:hypothetical protein